MQRYIITDLLKYVISDYIIWDVFKFVARVQNNIYNDISINFEDQKIDTSLIQIITPYYKLDSSRIKYDQNNTTIKIDDNVVKQSQGNTFTCNNIFCCDNFKKSITSYEYTDYGKCTYTLTINIKNDGYMFNAPTLKKIFTNSIIKRKFSYTGYKRYRNIEYYNNGMIKEITNTHNSNKEGIYKKFYSNGNHKTICNYLKDDLSGDYTDYYENGIKKIKCNYKPVVSYTKKHQKSIYNGPYIQYNNNGTIAIKGNYINDKKDGQFITYHINGNIKSIENYEEGDRLSNHSRYDNKGELKIKN
jgi:antitoxin component YwqK of YwqJK toxin-antitoxin module